MDDLKVLFCFILDYLPFIFAGSFLIALIHKGMEILKKACLVPVELPVIPDCDNLEYYGSCENCPYNLECDYK